VRRFAVYLLACFTALLLSSELALSLDIGGVGPDLLVIVVAAFAIGMPPRMAAWYGFSAGLLRDLLLVTPKGVSAFAYAVTAYGAALVGDVRGAWVFTGLVAGATVLSQVIYGVGTFLLGQTVDISPLPRLVFITTVYDALLAPLLMPILRRIATVEGAGAQSAQKD
jgi:rod shape-determining protein MreD